MRALAIKGAVYNIIGDIGDKQFPVGGSLLVLGKNNNNVLGLTTDESIILFSALLLNNTEVFELVGTIDGRDIEKAFKPLISRMQNKEYDVALYPLNRNEGEESNGIS